MKKGRALIDVIVLACCLDDEEMMFAEGLDKIRTLRLHPIDFHYLKQQTYQKLSEQSHYVDLMEVKYSIELVVDASITGGEPQAFDKDGKRVE